MSNKIAFSRELLEEIYSLYNRRELIAPDPLMFLYDFDDDGDREIVALTAAALAYGRVSGILKSVRTVLDRMEWKPSAYFAEKKPGDFSADFAGFKHRFTTGEDIACFFDGICEIRRKFGSLKNCFMAGYSQDDPNILPALEKFAGHLTGFCPDGKSYLFPSPARGSACKRPMLFLRWMIRKDDVDPGGWDSEIPPSVLLVPLDTHMHGIALRAGLTARKSGDIRTALEVTAGFAKFSPDDPVKYDFALTRFGIRDDMNMDELKEFLHSGGAVK
jgi:uncharacterized protein (TIGR02757 family)